MPLVYTGGDIDAWAPSLDDDAAAREWLGRYRRAAMSPDGIAAVIKMFLEIDVRHVLPTLHVPTLVLHRHGDRVVNWRASQVDGGPDPGRGPGRVARSGSFSVGRRRRRDRRRGPGIPHRYAGRRRARPGARHRDVHRRRRSPPGTAAALGDRRWTELLDAHDHAIRRELEAFRGHEIKTTGDGFLATFDGPARGIRCARAIRAAATDLDIDVRVGLHTGEIELRGDDISGLAVHIGQRVSATAGPAEIVVSSTVKDLVAGSGIEFEDRGEQELKGVPGTWRLFAVTN